MSCPEPLPPCDAELCARIQRGDERAFDALFLRYYDPLCRSIAPILKSRDAAEDVVQAMFVAIWQHRSAWRLQTTAKAYLYTAARKGAISHLRRTAVRERYDQRDDWVRAVARESVSPDQEFDRAELAHTIERAIAALPPRGREAFILQREHGLSYAEIAEVMGIAEGTVGVHIGRAIAALRRILTAVL